MLNLWLWPWPKIVQLEDLSKKFNTRDNVLKYTNYTKIHIYSWNWHQIIDQCFLARPPPKKIKYINTQHVPNKNKKVKIGQYWNDIIRKVSYSHFLLPGKFRVLRPLRTRRSKWSRRQVPRTARPRT